MSREISPPTRIGRYRLLRSLGTGAMGTVYLAHDESLDRRVALKTFHWIVGGDPRTRALQRKRLLREARSASSLSHPNVVTIYDVVEDEDSVYIAMEYVEGTSLADRLREDRPLEWPEAVGILGQVAAALDHLHDRGIVHRDIKPANILITEHGLVKITDFGVARPNDPRQTQETAIIGTPQYMAPEQIRGETPDPRTDVFALGILAYETLTGSRPFAGATIAEVTHAILHQPPSEPERRHSSVTPALGDVLRRALEKEPEKRQTSAGELVRELRRALGLTSDDGEPGLGSSSLNTAATAALSSGTEAGRGARRAGRVLTLAAVSVLSLAVLTAWLLITGGRDEAARLAREDGYIRLVTEGRRLLSENDPEASVVLFDAAEAIAPEHRRELRNLRALAIRQAEERGIAIRVAEARAALDAGRYDRVVAAARALLGTDRGRDRALEILDEVEGALAAGGGTPAPVLRSSAGADDPSSPPGTDPPLSSSSSSETPSHRVTLDVRLDSASPAGTLAVYVGPRQVLLEPFDFYERKGWFRREPREGSLRRQVLVDPSTESLLVLVARKGEAADTMRLTPRLRAGDTIRIDVRLPRSGPARATAH